MSGNEKVIINGNSAELRVELNRRMRNFHENYLMTARDYAEFGAYEEAVALLNECTGKYPMLKYYEAYYRHLTGESDDNVRELINEAESRPTDYCFPNKPEDIAVLRFAIDFGNGVRAKYYLGNLYYDKLQWQKAVLLWEEAAEAEPDFYIIHRNLAVAITTN
ncbi:tetratricopeptide repeat protein [Thermoclostridium stercorarium]|uniref:tetratricopeptide repeat protein n=1 Tax=Thermoclostridium stercorarium TaxID=1510 RepID=UPI000B0742C2